MKRIYGIFFMLLSFCFSGTAQNGIQYKIVVSQDGSGDYTSIQEAVEATKAFPDKRITIFIKNGIYKEKIRVPSWNNLLSFIGEDRDKTIITRGDYFGKIGKGRNSTFYTYTMLVEANDFYAENLTIENSAGKVGQAVALHVEGDRCVFRNCTILGNQDTMYLAGENSRQLFSGCTIEGTTDFIFGSATVVFSQCEILSKKDSYITAASTTPGKPFGFVFLDCNLKTAPGVKHVFLGRPWREYAKTAFIRCSLCKYIAAEGWHNWNKPRAESLAFYAEYDNYGEGAGIENRVSWSHILTEKEAESYTPVHILGEWVSADIKN